MCACLNDAIPKAKIFETSTKYLIILSLENWMCHKFAFEVVIDQVSIIFSGERVASLFVEVNLVIGPLLIIVEFSLC